MQAYVDTEIESMKERLYEYIDQRIAQDINDKRELESIHVNEAVEQLEAELRIEIDQW